MLTTRPTNRFPTVLPKIGDQQQSTVVRPKSANSNESIDNAYSLEHLFIALRRRIHRIVQNYNPSQFYNALKICARVFQSYASYNLNTIDEFGRRLNKTPRDNQKLLTIIEQFRHQLVELRHCHSTFEAELLVTTLAMDFNENDLEQQQQQGLSLPSATGKFSPRSRFSKYRLHHTRQAIELKSQLKQANENLQILLFDEFNANLTHLWEESDQYVNNSLPFHDRHMTYVLRLIPDVALKFEYALQICAKLFDLEATFSETNSHQKQKVATRKNSTDPTSSAMMMNFTPRSDFNRSQIDLPEQFPTNKFFEPLPTVHSADVTSASTVSSPGKLTPIRVNEPMNLISSEDENPIFPSLFTSSERFVNTNNDQTKLQLLIEQLEKRLKDEEAYRQRLLQCFQQTTKKSEELNRFPKGKMYSLVMSDTPAVTEYRKALFSSDYQIHQSVADELKIAIRETEQRIDWLKDVYSRARQCLN